MSLPNIVGSFAVLLADDLMIDDGALLRSMLDVHEQHGGSVLALMEMTSEEISAYGCAEVEPVRDGVVLVHSVVEKPRPEDAPSNLAVIGRSPEIGRVFQYHGAEHMTIHALEAGDPLTPEAIRKYPTAHPRCGTEFLVVVIALSIIAFTRVAQRLVVSVPQLFAADDATGRPADESR